MSKILKNQTASIVPIDDVGQQIPASGQLTIDPQDYLLYAASDDVITLIGAGTLVVNDGTSDLTIANGSKLIQGIFPNPIGIRGADGTELDVISDLGRNRIPTSIVFDRNTSTLDMTNRLKTSEANQLFSTLWNYTKQPITWAEQLTGGATLSAPGQKDPAYVKAELTTASGDEVLFQTKRFLRYQPYRTHELNFSHIFGEGDANQESRVGQFTNFNGWYWAMLNGVINVGYRNNTNELTGTIETNIPESSWNYDKLDGTGPSGYDFFSNGDQSGVDGSLKNATVFYIQYVWHGANGIEFGVEIFNRKVPVHQLKWSATSGIPFSRSSVLPIKWQTTNTGVTSAPTTSFMGPVSFDVHGGEQGEFGYVQSRGMLPADVINVTSTTVFTNILAVRPKATFGGAGVNNRGVILPTGYELQTDNDIYYEVLVDCEITGTFTDNGSDSIAEYDFGGFTFTGGRVIASGYASGQANNKAAGIGRSFSGDIFVAIDTVNNVQEGLVIRAVKFASNAGVSAAVTWREVY